MHPQTSNTVIRTEKDRQDAFKVVVDYAADHGIDEALRKFGGSLQHTDKEMLKSITPDEIRSLSNTKKKLEGTRKPISINNNNKRITE